MDDGMIHGDVNEGRNTTTTASSGIVAEVPNASVAMVMTDGTTIVGETGVVAQIAIVIAAGIGVGIAIAGMTGTAGDKQSV
jgi:hypothetical protein